MIPLSPVEQDQRDDWKRQLRSSVEKGDWSKDSDVALEEARRIFDAETDRRKGADAKAGIYLAAITALIPVLVSLLPMLWSDKSSNWVSGFGLFFFAWAVAYLVRAGEWAFRTLQVEGFAQLGPGEIASSWKKKCPKAALAKRLSAAVLFNFDLVNLKVTRIKMTHEFLRRAFLSFTILLVLQVLWPVSVYVYEFFQKLGASDPVSPLIMCFA